MSGTARTQRQIQRDPRPIMESALQGYVVQLLMLCGVSGLIWYAVPNGEYRSKRTAARLKGQGVRAGVADLALVLPGGLACFLELKTRIGRQSPEQKQFEALCEVNRAPYAVARTPEEAADILRLWGAIDKADVVGARVCVERAA